MEVIPNDVEGPEIDAEVPEALHIAAALEKHAGVAEGEEIYLQTLRADGTARWQPLAAVSVLPDTSGIRAKVVRAKGGSGTHGSSSSSHSRPHSQQQPHQQQQQSGGGHVSHGLGGLFKKLVVGGAGGTVGPGVSSGAFGVNRDDEDAYQQQLYEQQQLQELEEGAMRRSGSNSRASSRSSSRSSSPSGSKGSSHGHADNDRGDDGNDENDNNDDNDNIDDGNNDGGDDRGCDDNDNDD